MIFRTSFPRWEMLGPLEGTPETSMVGRSHFWVLKLLDSFPGRVRHYSREYIPQYIPSPKKGFPPPKKNMGLKALCFILKNTHPPLHWYFTKNLATKNTHHVSTTRGGHGSGEPDRGQGTIGTWRCWSKMEGLGEGFVWSMDFPLLFGTRSNISLPPTGKCLRNIMDWKKVPHLQHGICVVVPKRVYGYHIIFWGGRRRKHVFFSGKSGGCWSLNHVGFFQDALCQC